MGAIKVTNLNQVLQGFNLAEEKLEQAAYIALYQVAQAIEGQAKDNANTGAHAPNKPRIAGTGPGPNIATGNLVSKIKADKPKKGLNGYSAIIGSSAEYARAVELGHPNWKSGVKYPYMEPAANSLVRNGTLNRIFTGAFLITVRGMQ